MTAKKIDITDTAHSALKCFCKKRGISVKEWASRTVLQAIALEQEGVASLPPPTSASRSGSKDRTLESMAKLSERPSFWDAQGRKPKKPRQYQGRPAITHELRGRRF